MPYADTLDFELKAVYLSLPSNVSIGGSGDGWSLRVVNRARLHKRGYILALEGVKSRNEAEALRGAVAAIKSMTCQRLGKESIIPSTSAARQSRTKTGEQSVP